VSKVAKRKGFEPFPNFVTQFDLGNNCSINCLSRYVEPRGPKRALVLAVLMLGLSACALDPVETDPAKAEARAAAMRQDCYSRGGTWSETTRACIGADPRR
jgi:hypothetical protein